MNNIFSIIYKNSNQVYFWSKLGFTFLVLILWLFDSSLFGNESSISLSAASVIAILSVLTYGIIFKNQPQNENVFKIYLFIDIALTHFLILPGHSSQIVFTILCFLLLSQLTLFLKGRSRVLFSTIYFSLLIAMISIGVMIGEVQKPVATITALLLFNVTVFVFFIMTEKTFTFFEEQLNNLAEERNQLQHSQENLSKEVRLTSHRLEILNKDLRRKSFEIQNILNLTGQLGSSSDSKQILSSFLLTLVGQLGCMHALFLGLEDPSKNYYSIIEQKGIHDKRIEKLRIYKNSYLMQILQATRESMPIMNIPKDQLYADEKELLSFFSDDLLNPIIVKNKVIGMFIIGKKISGTPFNREDLNLITILANQAAFILEQSNLNNEIYEFYNKTVRALLRAMEVKYSYGKGHAIRTAQYVQAIARKLNYTAPDMKYLTYGTILHDIGKIAIKDEILHYDKKITGDNQQIKNKILDHTLIGASILKSVGFDEPMVDLALHHHEWINGKGYPHGLRGDNISLGVRILSVCNAYDSMLSDAPYRKSLNEEWAMDQLRRNAGVQFDPEIVETFLNELELNPVVQNLNSRN